MILNTLICIRFMLLSSMYSCIPFDKCFCKFITAFEISAKRDQSYLINIITVYSEKRRLSLKGQYNC